MCWDLIDLTAGHNDNRIKLQRGKVEVDGERRAQSEG